MYAVRPSSLSQQAFPSSLSFKVAFLFRVGWAGRPRWVYSCKVNARCHVRPYQGKSTASRSICKVKPLRASLVLWWGTTWESEVPYIFAFPDIFFRVGSTCLALGYTSSWNFSSLGLLFVSIRVGSVSL